MPAVGFPPRADVASAPSVHGRVRLGRLLRDDRARYPIGLVALLGLYYGAAQLGYALEFAGPVAAIVWLPVGVAIAFLYLGGLRFWPAVVVGDLLANDYSALPAGSALGQTCGNLLEVLVATLLLRRLVPRGSPLGSVGGLARVVIALAAGTLVSATVGSLSLRLGNVVSAGALVRVWGTWWLGDFAGALIVVPLALAWHRPPSRAWWRAHWIEGALVLAAVAGLSELALRTGRPLTYIVFPALIWAALRLGQRGVTLAVVVAASFTVWETTHHVGPFVFTSINHSVLSTQLYIALAALSTLCLAAVVSEREDVAERLVASRARLLDTADTERRRLEHNLHDGAQQRLTALVVRLRLAAEEAERAPEKAPALFERAETELALAIDELRELSHGIQPPLLAARGLADAIRAVAARSTVPIELPELPAGRLDESAEATAYYVFAEAVTNAERYAGASSIEVRVALSEGVLRLEVRDDGAGGADEAAGSGLQGLRDRVEATGGRFEVVSARGRGTLVAAEIPATAVAGS
jgi:signal transduction histidine kinase